MDADKEVNEVLQNRNYNQKIIFSDICHGFGCENEPKYFRFSDEGFW